MTNYICRYTKNISNAIYKTINANTDKEAVIMAMASGLYYKEQQHIEVVNLETQEIVYSDYDEYF